MSYLQPWMLWALPAVLLPIIIHLLNRLRYRTVHWGAMMFLLKATGRAGRQPRAEPWSTSTQTCGSTSTFTAPAVPSASAAN